jgi:hypothetical protein
MMMTLRGDDVLTAQETTRGGLRRAGRRRGPAAAPDTRAALKILKCNEHEAFLSP